MEPKELTCQEIEKNIVNFIKHDLKKEDVIPFVEHVRQCPSCQDEMEITYIMMVGMKQLDEGKDLTADFKQAMYHEMDEQYQEVVKEKRNDLLAKGIGIIFLVGLVAASALRYFLSQSGGIPFL